MGAGAGVEARRGGLGEGGQGGGERRGELCQGRGLLGRNRHPGEVGGGAQGRGVQGYFFRLVKLKRSAIEETKPD